MPVYEYGCARGHQYERVEGFDAPPEHVCPHCGGSSRRRLSLPAVIFKGSGFYSTDNRKSQSFDSAQDRSGGNGGSTEGASGESGHPHDSGSDGKAEPTAAGSGPDS